MKTLLKTLIITLLLLCPLSAPTYGQGGNDAVIPPDFPAQELRFKNLTIEDGLSQSSVFAIVQDKRGFMWFGTWGGLNRYDGYQFTIYKHDPQDPYSLSDSEIRALYEDSQGELWVGTINGLCRYDREKDRFIRYQHDPENLSSLAGNRVYAITEGHNATLWIGTENGGLSKFDRHTGRFTRYQHDPEQAESLSHNDVRALHFDAQGMLWIGTWGGGLNRFDPNTERFTHYQHASNNPASLSDDSVRSVYEDQQGTVWVGTKSGGLSRFDRETQLFTNYLPDSNNPLSLSDKDVRSIYETRAGVLWMGTQGGGLNRFERNTQQFTHSFPIEDNQIWSMYEDRSGILWIGTSQKGVYKALPRTKNFMHYQHDPDVPTSLSGNDVWSIFEDRYGVLWVGVWGHGLNRFDREAGTFTHFKPDPDNPHNISQQGVVEITEDHEGMLWIGTTNDGLYKYDRKIGRFTNYTHDPDDPQSLPHNFVVGILEDEQGTLWIASYYDKSLSKFDRDTETFTTFTHDPEDPHSIGDYKVKKLFEDSEGNLWLTTTGGGLSNFDRETERFTHYTHDPANSKSISHDNTTMVYEDHAGNLWVATFGGGLNKFDRDTETFMAYLEKNGLPSDAVMGILEDEQGNLWLSTFRGISRFDPATETFRNYIPFDGLQSLEFNSTVAFKDRNGRMYFGGVNGFNAFYPHEIRDNPHIPPVVLTDFQIFHIPVSISDDSVLNKSVEELDEITLSYQESVFTFGFAALDYTLPEKNRYRYMLEGFEQKWNEVDSTRRFATYTNLDPGEYTFRVLGTNSDGVWNEEGTSVHLTITPPWWATTWFRIGVGLMVVGLLVGGYGWRVRTLQARSRELEIQVVERTQRLQLAKKRAEEANRAKSTFLANMSHELRTPLNAILGFGRNLARAQDLKPEHRDEADIITRSGDHLLEMIDEILSLSRIEAGRFELQQAPFDLVRTLEDIGQMITSPAQAKGLRFDLELDATLPRIVRGDVGKIRQVLINMLGNAVKFTEQGYVCLRACTKPMDNDPARVLLQLAVEDSGLGVPEEQLHRIFDSFTQGDHTGDAVEGTGLGLAICRSLVDVMEGRIDVTSKPGKGSLFTATVPLELEEASALVHEDTRETQVVGLKPGQKPKRILVAEDNADSLVLLTTMLERVGFKLRGVENGERAIEAFKSWRPHLICMDMRMPVMDGYAATKAIRELPGGERVKILAVTASVFEEQRDEILGAGCDEFVRKPVQEGDFFEIIADLLEVEYIYTDATQAQVPGKASALTVEMLSKLPPELVSELRQAALVLDRAAMAELIERVAGHAPETAKGLQRLVDDFQLERIRELVGDVI